MNPRTFLSALPAFVAGSWMLAACVKDAGPVPTKTSYYGTLNDYHGAPVKGIKFYVYGDKYYNPSGTLFGSRSVTVVIDSAVSDESGRFSNTFADQEDIDHYTYSSSGLEKNLTGYLKKGESNWLPLETWRFYTLAYRLRVLNNVHPPLLLSSDFYQMEVTAREFDTTVCKRVNWITGDGQVTGWIGNDAYYMLNGVRHSSYLNLDFQFNGTENTDTLFKNCTLDCSTF